MANEESVYIHSIIDAVMATHLPEQHTLSQQSADVYMMLFC